MLYLLFNPDDVFYYGANQHKNCNIVYYKPSNYKETIMAI